MFGIFLIALSTASTEIGTVIGKQGVRDHRESVYTMGFLNMLWGALFLLALAFFVPKNFFADGFPGGFIFSLASLPTFIPRVILEVAQMHATMLAIVRADRSTFGFLRILTIPLLLAVDVLVGYEISTPQLAGIGLIVASLIFLFINHGLRRAGVWFVLFTAVNAVATISLFKYNITHFNSVEAEQGIMIMILVAYFFVVAHFFAKENPVRFLGQPIFLAQSLAQGVGTVIMSFAYLFAAASIITTAKRSCNILWSMLSGNIYFHEKHFLVKLVAFLLVVAGLFLLVV